MPRIGEILVASGACSTGAVQEALQNQAFFGARLGTNLLQLGAVDEAQIADALHEIHGVPAVSGDLDPDPRAVALVRRQVVERYEVIPYASADRKLTLLVRDPRDLQLLDDVAFATGKRVVPVVVPEARLWALMRKLYGVERGVRGIELEGGARRAPADEVEAVPMTCFTPQPVDLMSEDDFTAMYGRTH